MVSEKDEPSVPARETGSQRWTHGESMPVGVLLASLEHARHGTLGRVPCEGVGSHAMVSGPMGVRLSARAFAAL